ncbi:MAG: PqqD family protein [Actinobacteria bacterium]|nr:PqqD family protein [Actinomycetota bacterium]
MRLATREFYRLNTTGALIWEAMEGGPTRSELLATLTRQVAGSPSDLSEQLDAFVSAMDELGLIEVVTPEE